MTGTEPREPGLALARAAWRARPLLLGSIVVVTATLVTLRLGPVPVLPAYLLLCLGGTTLAVVDARALRLPDVLLAPLGLAVLVLLGLAAVVEGSVAGLGRALAAATIGFVAFLVLALLSPGALGMGDVKLAAVLGLATGRLGWEVSLLATLAAFGLVALVGVVLLALRRVTRSSALPFGPFMLAGSLLAVLAASPPIG